MEYQTQFPLQFNNREYLYVRRYNEYSGHCDDTSFVISERDHMQLRKNCLIILEVDLNFS